MQSQYKSRPRDAAAERIECYIIENRLHPYDKLPSERDMCELWGFNRTTLRSAIHRLVVDGVLYNRVGSGTFVAPEKLVCNLQDLRPFSEVAQSAGRTQKNRVIAAHVQECTKQLSQKLQRPLGHKVFQLIRLRYVDDNPVLLETSYVDAERCPGIELHDFAKESLYNVMESVYGMTMRGSRGAEKLGVTYASEEEAKLLGIREGDAVIYRSGVVSDGDGVPTEYFKSVARSEFIRFASVLTR